MSTALSDYAYTYPEELVALHPCEPRDACRLLVLNSKTQEIVHKTFVDVLDYFNPGDVLVVNDSKVFPCRLRIPMPTGRVQEILFLKQMGSSAFAETWQVMVNHSKKVKPGMRVDCEHLSIELNPIDNNPALRLAHVTSDIPVLEALHKQAAMPLPPYIKRQAEEIDLKDYQTVYASQVGSVAAPTAGLHFTPNLLEQLEHKGIQIAKVTLHVGLGTFLPVTADDLTQHQMHYEDYELSEACCRTIANAKRGGKQIISVGTTSTRVLESVAKKFGELKPHRGSTNLFIYPPYEFKIVDKLITNFHQPESTLLALVSAFAGREFMLKAYAEAIREKYRLFSYGDAMLVY